MGYQLVPVITASVVCGVISFFCPLLVRKGPNRGTYQLCFVLTGICLYMFWATTYMHQMNPLIGPQLHNATILLIQREWDGLYKNGVPAEAMHGHAPAAPHAH